MNLTLSHAGIPRERKRHGAPSTPLGNAGLVADLSPLDGGANHREMRRWVVAILTASARFLACNLASTEVT